MFISHFSLAAIAKQQNVITASLLTVKRYDLSLHNNLIPHILRIYSRQPTLIALGHRVGQYTVAHALLAWSLVRPNCVQTESWGNAHSRRAC